MAEAALSFAVQKLGQLVIEKVGFIQGVEGQLKWLKDELEMMQCLLKDAAEKQGDDERIRKWVSDIRDLAQDADDAIETFVLRVDAPRMSRGLLGRFAYLPRHAYHLNRVGEEIERIRAGLEALDKRRERYGIERTGPEEPVFVRRSKDVEWRRRLSPWQKDKHVVGMEGDVDLLLRRAILEERDGLSVAGIVGMGGIGKSTLARVVYNHAAVAERFERRGWVCISSEFKEKEMIKELVVQLAEPTEDKLKIVETMEKMEVPSLREMLQRCLMGRRYLIVVDDVWEQGHWKSLASALPCQDQPSRLLLTSRSRDITKPAQYVHGMKILDSHTSWQLFLSKAFGDNNDGQCPQDLENIGRKILRKCNGLPLAITVVGGLLAEQRQTESEWEKVLKGMNSYSGRGDENSVSAILELSYHNLPPQLKSCFLCMGFFNEDATIRVEKLVQVWIAQGLVVQNEAGEEETMEEIARRYLDELINRNMVQVKEMSTDNRVKTCNIHDLLRELSITKAKEEINFEILRDGDSRSLDKPRHRVIYYEKESFVYSNDRNKRLRSLFFRGGSYINACSTTPSHWKSFELLRILDFEDFGLKKLPDAIGSLVGLRHLGLRNNHIKKLPSSLGHLKNLEVLDVSKNYFVKVPSAIWNMDNLRHLYMSFFIFDAPLKKSALNYLQTLNYILIYHWMPDHPRHMTNLRKLGIELDRDSDVMKLCTTSLAMLDNLVCLNLRWYGFRRVMPLDGLGTLHRLTQLKLHGELAMLPSAGNFPPNISYLSLVRTHLDEDPTPVLEKLPKLLHLKLNDAYVGSKMVVSDDGFPRLRVLCLRSMLRLRNIKVGKGGLPQIERFETNECHDLLVPEKLRCMSISL
ncbi:disease resistance protein rpp13 [Phtheirospermum japonicum]|uniref:Disease resistance protein rpp13 n=1 Tax=Phtheirospermum japonicum TaxID=374723 RepID=A0A830BXF5_9LAMI|nr:disease resistance protein rpp13 [Phtheirospermum japonicum]